MSLRLAAASALLLFLCLTGCSESGPSLHTVEGVLQFQGTPLPRVDLKFFPVEGGRGSNTKTDDQGNFIMYYTGAKPGVVTGDHIVYIEYYPRFVPASDGSGGREEKPSRPLEEALKKYGVRKTSPHRVTIENDVKDLVINLQ